MGQGYTLGSYLYFFQKCRPDHSVLTIDRIPFYRGRAYLTEVCLQWRPEYSLFSFLPWIPVNHVLFARKKDDIGPESAFIFPILTNISNS